MSAKRSCHSPGAPCSCSRSTGHLLDYVELFLLVAAGCLILYVAWMWAGNAVAGGTPPVMAEITIRSGDTLWGMAQRYGDPDVYILKRVDALVKANALERGSVLREGQRLIIPVTSRSAELYCGAKYASRGIAD